MSSKTKIVVLHMKEVVYTLVFVFLAIVLGIVLFFMFGSGRSPASETAGKGRYTAGVYSSSITLNDNTFDVEVTVDSSKITSIDLVNLSETTSAMFPLMEPVLESLSSQIYTSQSLEGISWSEDSKYTSMVLLHAIEDALKKAEND
ncbi:MAG: hypothetical protein UFJ18_08555 [Blautia sp.]|nr:hypothetical protein [Eubacteriales bacterium]MED9966829.1 hypothetical protein [Blautia sp.]